MQLNDTARPRRLAARVSGALATFLVIVTNAMAAPGHADAEHLRVYRDQWGVPHIYAPTEDAGYFGLGYANAEDDLEGLLAMYLATDGRAASVYGRGIIPWGFSALQLDTIVRQWRLDAAARGAVAQLSPRVRRNFESYAAGITHYMAQHPDRVPSWGKAPELWQVLALPQVLLWFFQSQDGISDCAAGGVRMAESAPPPSRAPAQWASNVWAIAPWRTAEGATMILSDPHGPIDGAAFYEFRMRAGALDFSGYALGGYFLLGQNPDVAWGLTTGGPDASDCYKLSTDSADPGRYRIHGRWKQLAGQQVRIQVKGEADIEKNFELAEINGLPAAVVSHSPAGLYAVATPYAKGLELLANQIDLMIRARTVGDIREANRLLGLFPQNLLAADRTGNIYYVRSGRTPKRSPQLDWRRPVSGDDMASRWQGLHPAEDLVQITNPPTGYLQNNNALPALMTAEPALVDPQSYPAYIYNDVPQLQFIDRAFRTNDVLGNAYAFRTEDAKRFAFDEKWYDSERWRTLIRSAAAAALPGELAAKSREFRRVLDRLSAFDGFARADSVAASNHVYWRTALWQSLSVPLKEELADVLADGVAPSRELAHEALAAVDAAIATMHEASGSVDTPYGEINRIGRNAGAHWPVGGGPALQVQNYFSCNDELTVRAGVCRFTMRAFVFSKINEDHTRLATSGSRALRLTIFGETPTVFTLHNFGQSSDPASPHYDDQARLLSSRAELKQIVLDEDALRKVATRVIELPLTRNRAHTRNASAAQ